MSRKEVDRLNVIQSVLSKQLTQAQAAKQLSLCIRQIKRLVKRYREQGAAGLVSGHRGKRPNNAIEASVREKALSLIREHYSDFGPTLASEKLALHVSDESEHSFRFNPITHFGLNRSPVSVLSDHF